MYANLINQKYRKLLSYIHLISLTWSGMRYGANHSPTAMAAACSALRRFQLSATNFLPAFAAKYASRMNSV